MSMLSFQLWAKAESSFVLFPVATIETNEELDWSNEEN